MKIYQVGGSVRDRLRGRPPPRLARSMASFGSAIKYTTLPPSAMYSASPCWMDGGIGAPPPTESDTL